MLKDKGAEAMLGTVSKTDRQIVDAMLNKHRLKLMEALIKRFDDGAYIEQLSKATGLPRGSVAYHLTLLERVGLVTSQYQILKQAKGKAKGKAVRVYKINPKRLLEGTAAAMRAGATVIAEAIKEIEAGT